MESLLETPDLGAETDSEADEAELKIGRKRQIIGILVRFTHSLCFPMELTLASQSQVLQLGIMLHSLVIGFTLALASGADFESLVTAILFHQIFEGLSLGIRIAALPPPRDPQQPGLWWLHPVLALLFALTTPAGILSGVLVFGNSSGGNRSSGAAGAGTKIAEGVLCAISAGMLIYAACVEMLAADIVLDPTLWRASKRRQLMALASVALGATGMVLLE
jgi:zinc transporter 1/2/3